MSDGWNGPVIQRGAMAADVVGRQFTQISNEFFRDPRLGAAAKGVFGFISTHRDGYGITPELIAQHMRNGVSAVRAALTELEKHGYLVRTQPRNPNGTLGRIVYKITDMPDGLAIIESAPYPEQRFPRSEPVVENPQPAATCENTPQGERSPRSEPVVENPHADKPQADNRMHKNTSHKNTNLEKTREEPPPPTSSAPSHGERAQKQEEEGSRSASTSNSLDPVALSLVDQAATRWDKPPTAGERARIAEKAAEALAGGATPAGVVHGLTRDLETARNPIAVVTTRTHLPGWADHDPAALAAEAAKPKLPPRCDDPRHDPYAHDSNRMLVDDEGRGLGQCPRCSASAISQQPALSLVPGPRQETTTDVYADRAAQARALLTARGIGT